MSVEGPFAVSRGQGPGCSPRKRGAARPGGRGRTTSARPTHDASRAAGERCSRGLTMPALRQLTCLLAGSASLLSLMPGLSATAASQSAASTSLARLCFVASASARKWCADRHQRGQASRRVAKSVGDPSRQPTSLSRHRAVNPRSSRRVNPGNPA